MRSYLLALSLLLSLPVAAQTTLKLPPGSIRWSASRLLTVADFKGRPRPSEGHAALTSANINSGASCRNGIFMGTARASFDPSSSWVREPAAMTPALLHHEQLHFDLAEVYARRLRQQLLALHVACDQMGPEFNRLSQAGYAAWQKAEDDYDRDTSHGLNKPRQALWDAQVRQQLTELAAFAEPEA